jgi:hypothetical protein
MLKGKKPIEIFDYSNLDKSYRDLLKKYHPDVGGTEDDFLYLTECYKIAKQELESGYAISSDRIYFYRDTALGLLPKEISYHSAVNFSYGKVYVGSDLLIYEFFGNSMENELANAFVDFELPDGELKNRLSDQLPIQGIKILNIKQGKELDRQFAIINKHPDSMLLIDVMKHQIPLETSVWIFNRLYALGCYMSIIGVYNLDISPYNLLLNLRNHSIQLLGGWWYSAQKNKKMTKMPITTYNLLTNKMKDTKTATIEIVTEQIKNIMRLILKDRDIPAPYRNWLSLPAQENIVHEYYQWENEVMIKIFPVKKFYEWTI